MFMEKICVELIETLRKVTLALLIKKFCRNREKNFLAILELTGKLRRIFIIIWAKILKNFKSKC